MEKHPPRLKIKDEVVLEGKGLQQLLDILKDKEYQILGPKARHGAIEFDELESITDLPAGWRDEQRAGHYRLEQNDHAGLFDHVVGPQSWKKYLYPSLVRVCRVIGEEKGFRVTDEREQIPKYAFVGVRSCDIHAIAALDRVFNNDEFSDPTYNSRRRGAFTLAVNCTRPGGTCFCVSMNTGPKATFGFDIALTEVAEGECHYYVAEVGSDTGSAILQELTYQEAGERERQMAGNLLDEASKRMGRKLNTSGLKALFYEHFDHPRWEDVAKRCLTCGNCTMVCPTCFCTNIEEKNALNGESAERFRRWDSCFSRDFSYMHGGSIRGSEKSRYRQWLTHKLATWLDQFGTLGCVGCGRCITWCPVGIDMTEEAAAILEQKDRSAL